MMNNDKDLILRDVRIRENVLLKNVYLWMIAGLAVTAGVSYGLAHSAAFIRFFFTNPMLMIAVFIAQLVLVMVLSGRIERLSTGTAIALFLGYSAVTGLTLTSIFIVYAGTVIASAFVSAAAVFAAGAIYGSVTKKDLRGIGGYLTMALIGMLVALLINMFLGSSTLDLLISAVGVLLFTGLTAWDSQKISDMNRSYGSMMTREELTKVGILGALDLYLDFLNIFLYLLRIFGRSSDN